MIKFLYFRDVSTLADDDATNDSVCWPASSLMGMEPIHDSRLTLYFRQVKNVFTTAQEEGTGRCDTVTLNLTTVNTHKTAMNAIANAISYNKSSFIVIADDVNTEYLDGSGIADVRSIVVRAENS